MGHRQAFTDPVDISIDIPHLTLSGHVVILIRQRDHVVSNGYPEQLDLLNFVLCEKILRVVHTPPMAGKCLPPDAFV